MKHKSNFITILTSFLAFVQTQFSCNMKVFQSDGEGEFVNHSVSTFFTNNGTHHRLSCAHTPQQNGRAEQKHRHVTETGLPMMFKAHAPATLRVDAFSFATYIINRLPSKFLDYKSPFELLYHSSPNYNIFKAFGCTVFPDLRNNSVNKLEPRSASCIFIGYSSQYKGYRCLDPTTGRIYTTRHAVFHEHHFPLSGITSSSDQARMVFFNLMMSLLFCFRPNQVHTNLLPQFPSQQCLAPYVPQQPTLPPQILFLMKDLFS